MAATYANAMPLSMKDGIPYAIAKALPVLEGDLFNQSAPNPDPIPVLYGEAVLAIIQFSAPSQSTAYVVMQCDLGDGVWIDVAGVVFSGVGNAVFVMSAGVAGNNAFQNSRVVGTAPAANFSNAMTLGGRLRFVGKGSSSSSSSSSASSGSVPSQLTVTVRYKLLGLR